jgi:transposase InsO family protein
LSAFTVEERFSVTSFAIGPATSSNLVRATNPGEGYSTLKTELVHNVIFLTRDSARDAIAEWIEIFYNGKRRHSSLGYATPLEAERRYYDQQELNLREAA